MTDEIKIDIETMPLADLKAAALAEEAKEVVAAEPDPAPKVEAVADIETPVETEPEQYVIKSEIDLGDGSGVQVFTGRGATELEALRDQNTKLVDAQRNATKKIHDLNSQRKAEDSRSDQQKTDDEYVIAQRLQKEPTKAIRDVVREVIAEREETQKRSLATQQAFVDGHPDYIADTENGARITHEVQRLGYNEFTEDSLEKAYQSLKASGLLKIKVEEAGGTTEAEAAPVERIAQPVVEATQSRSLKKSSTVSTRGSHAPIQKVGLSEDELYSIPLEKLRQLSNEQLAKAGME